MMGFMYLPHKLFCILLMLFYCFIVFTGCQKSKVPSPAPPDQNKTEEYVHEPSDEAAIKTFFSFIKALENSRHDEAYQYVSKNSIEVYNQEVSSGETAFDIFKQRLDNTKESGEMKLLFVSTPQVESNDGHRSVLSLHNINISDNDPMRIVMLYEKGMWKLLLK